MCQSVNTNDLCHDKGPTGNCAAVQFVSDLTIDIDLCMHDGDDSGDDFGEVTNVVTTTPQVFLSVHQRSAFKATLQRLKTICASYVGLAQKCSTCLQLTGRRSHWRVRSFEKFAV
jgi:hypothetical protein